MSNTKKLGPASLILCTHLYFVGLRPQRVNPATTMIIFTPLCSASVRTVIRVPCAAHPFSDSLLFASDLPLFAQAVLSPCTTDQHQVVLRWSGADQLPDSCGCSGGSRRGGYFRCLHWTNVLQRMASITFICIVLTRTSPTTSDYVHLHTN